MAWPGPAAGAHTEYVLTEAARHAGEACVISADRGEPAGRRSLRGVSTHIRLRTHPELQFRSSDLAVLDIAVLPFVRGIEWHAELLWLLE